MLACEMAPARWRHLCPFLLGAGEIAPPASTIPDANHLCLKTLTATLNPQPQNPVAHLTNQRVRLQGRKKVEEQREEAGRLKKTPLRLDQASCFAELCDYVFVELLFCRVMPKSMLESEICGETVGEVRAVSDMHERKAEMARQADAFIALPSGHGTLEELLEAVMYGIIVYSCINLDWTVAKFFWYIFFMFFTFMYFTFYGMMAVAMTPNSDIAAIISTAFYAIWNIFAGYLIPRPRIPVWWRWYCWACPVAWTLYGLVISQYGNYDESKMEEGLTVREFIHEHFGFKHDFVGWVALAVVGFTLLFAFVFAFAIKVFNFQRR